MPFAGFPAREPTRAGPTLSRVACRYRFRTDRLWISPRAPELSTGRSETARRPLPRNRRAGTQLRA